MDECNPPLIQQLKAAIEKSCPIDAISIGRRDDRSTWKFSPVSSATPEQIAAAWAALVAFTPYHLVPKIIVMRRLQALGKLEDAINALRADIVLYELWSAVSEIRSDDPNARALLMAIGAKPDDILAPA